MSDSTSSSLLTRLRRPGEPAAWRRFIDLYTPLLYHWACRMGLPPPRGPCYRVRFGRRPRILLREPLRTPDRIADPSPGRPS